MFLASYLNWSGVLGLALGRFVCLYLYQGWSLGFFLFYVLYLIRLLILNHNCVGIHDYDTQHNIPMALLSLWFFSLLIIFYMQKLTECQHMSHFFTLSKFRYLSLLTTLFMKKVYITPQTIQGGLLHPLNYKIRFPTLWTFKNWSNNPQTVFGRWFCYSDGGFIFIFFIYFG